MITPADTPDQLTEPARPTHAAPGAPLVLVLHGGRGVIGTQEYQDLVRDSLTEFGQEGTGDDDVAALTQHSAFIGEVGEDDPGELPGAIEKARGVLAAAAGTDPADVVVVHYLAIPPQAFEPLTKALAAHGMTRGHDGRPDTVLVVYEKPYGTSPERFRELDAVVHDVLEEQQVFRIDHFLGKEATQNLHVLRFANELIGAVWNRHHVAQVQIDVPETLDVGQRAEFYDGTSICTCATWWRFQTAPISSLANRSTCRFWVASLPRKWSIRKTCCSSSTSCTTASSSRNVSDDVP